MGFQETEYIKFCLQVNKQVIYKFSGKINEKIIVKIAKSVEDILYKNYTNPTKMQNVFELIVETLQNILNYSYGTVKLKDNKREAPCSFTLFYDSNQDIYTLDSCNLIKYEQKKVIEKKLDEIKNLNDNNLRKLLRQKARLKEDSHDKGAGLGFIIMARKTIKDIEVSFTTYNANILHYKQRLII